MITLLLQTISSAFLYTRTVGRTPSSAAGALAGLFEPPAHLFQRSISMWSMCFRPRPEATR